MKYKLELTINKPRAEVWRVFDDPTKLDQWQPSLIQTEQLEGIAGQPGSVTRLTYKNGEREFSLFEKITHRAEPERLDQLYQNVHASAYHLKLAGVLHDDFSDYPLLTPLSAPLMHERGTLNGKRTVYLINTYMLAFFDQYLKDQPSPLLAGPSGDFPEVQFDTRSVSR